jgi:hypothetical protein
MLHNEQPQPELFLLFHRQPACQKVGGGASNLLRRQPYFGTGGINLIFLLKWTRYENALKHLRALLVVLIKDLKTQAKSLSRGAALEIGRARDEGGERGFIRDRKRTRLLQTNEARPKTLSRVAD